MHVVRIDTYKDKRKIRDKVVGALPLKISFESLWSEFVTSSLTGVLSAL